MRIVLERLGAQGRRRCEPKEADASALESTPLQLTEVDAAGDQPEWVPSADFLSRARND